MKSAEAKDAGRVAGAALRELTGLVHGVHSTIDTAVHGALGLGLGPAATPFREVSRALTTGGYRLAGGGLDLAARAAGRIGQVALRDDDHRPSVHDRPAPTHVLAVGLGLRGDRVAQRAASMAPPLHARRDGRAVEPTREGLATAYPDATGTVAVFVHGLFETEAAWRLGGPERPSYAARLATDLGVTSVVVRYNTGLRVSENARDLAGLLDAIVDCWPVPVERLVLIGHSMGGLVLHGALAAHADASIWAPLVTDTITLGTPHHGSPVAAGVARAEEFLARHPMSGWLGEFLGRRSGGLRDLVHGNVVAADWEAHDPGHRDDRRTHPAPAAGIHHHAIVAVTTAGRLPAEVAMRLGDFLVPHRSATHADMEEGLGRFAEERVAVVRGVGHLGLLNDDTAYAYIRGWLA